MSTSKHFSILIVEDNLDFLEVLNDFLSEEGFETKTAENGKIALELLSKQPFDLILSDVQMPFMDGIELLKKVRSHHATVPVVLLITGQSKISADEAKTLGAANLIHKPFDFKELLSAIGQIRVQTAS